MLRARVINPGSIDTPGERAFASAEQIQRAGASIPWGRIGTPRDIGKAAAFLASDDADDSTGTRVQVAGGYRLGVQLPSVSAE